MLVTFKHDNGTKILVEVYPQSTCWEVDRAFESVSAYSQAAREWVADRPCKLQNFHGTTTLHWTTEVDGWYEITQG